mgnify:CR=1 FL=1
MNFEYRTEFSESESEYLWSAGVCLDDWDYAIITHDLNEFEETDDMTTADEWDENSKSYKTVAVPFKLLAPKEYNLSRLLQGCCDNTWYKIKWQGKDAIIGLAYHA